MLVSPVGNVMVHSPSAVNVAMVYAPLVVVEGEQAVANAGLISNPSVNNIVNNIVNLYGAIPHSHSQEARRSC